MAVLRFQKRHRITVVHTTVRYYTNTDVTILYVIMHCTCGVIEADRVSELGSFFLFANCPFFVFTLFLTGETNKDKLLIT